MEFDFDTPKETLAAPKNSKALTLYLLLQSGIKGIDNYEAVVQGRFWKLNTRISDLINKHGVEIHKKDEKGKNQFGHQYISKRYCLFENQREQNIEIYNRINKK